MNERDAFVRRICEEPDDDTVRLVFADWIEEHTGFGSWAGFIRHQIQSPVSPCHNAPLTALIQLEELVGPLPHKYLTNVSGVRGATVTYPNGMEFWFARGFVSEIRLPLAAFMGHAATIFRSHPVTRVVLTDREPLRSGQDWFFYRGEVAVPVSRFFLPPVLFDALETAWFTDQQNAVLDISAACVSYGRSLVNLPPLPASSSGTAARSH